MKEYFQYSKALLKMYQADLDEKLNANEFELDKVSQTIIDEIKEKSFFAIENYYSKERCNQIIDEIDRLHLKFENSIWNDKSNADNRLFGAEKFSSLIEEFYNDAFLNSVKDGYHEYKKIVGFTLAAKLNAVKDNIGSGGGWHRDQVFGKQLKAILYLTDVTENHGPFQLIPTTHKSSKKLDAILKVNLKAKQNRLNQSLVDGLLEFPEYNLVECTYKAGTLLLVDTTCIHRGKPIAQDFRYALTNYWYKNRIPKHIVPLVLK